MPAYARKENDLKSPGHFWHGLVGQVDKNLPAAAPLDIGVCHGKICKMTLLEDDRWAAFHDVAQQRAR